MIDVVCAVIVLKGKFLLTQRSPQMIHAGKWEFPGGKIQEGESATEALQRELSEELGIEVCIEKSLEPKLWDYGSKQIKLIPMLCYITKGKVKLYEHSAMGWFTKASYQYVDVLEADMAIIETIKNTL